MKRLKETVKSETVLNLDGTKDLFENDQLTCMTHICMCTSRRRIDSAVDTVVDETRLTVV